MNLLQTYLPGLSFCCFSVVGLTYCAYSIRRLRRSFTTWRDGVLLAQGAVVLGVAAMSLALLTIHGAGLLAVFTYNHDQPSIQHVFSQLHSTPIVQARAAALLNRAYEFELVSRPTASPAPPEVTEANQAGTALDKALWLVARLDNAEVRLVVGRDRGSAWVAWNDERGEEWLFDPTVRKPIARHAVSGSQYLARQEWSKAELVAHSASPKQLIAAVAR